MKTLYITRGLPASGKSTWAKKQVEAPASATVRVNRDCLRYTLYGHRKGQGRLPHEAEVLVTTVQQRAVRGALKAGNNVIVDDMNLRPKYVREWAKLAWREGVEVEVKEFPLTIEESVDRDRYRWVCSGEGVGEDAIRSMRKWLGKGDSLLPADLTRDYPVVGKPFTPVEGRFHAYIVDIDGTLALNTGRNIYDLSRVQEDALNYPVAEVVHELYNAGNWIIYLSGREETAYDETLKWLNRYMPIDYDRSTGDPLLYMRPEGDRRKDYIVKLDLFDSYVRPYWNVSGVFDDRDQCVRLWRDLGLTCFQVAEGSF